MGTVQFIPESELARPVARQLKVALVCMPWGALDLPSAALSTLAPLAKRLPFVRSVDVLYANIRWMDHVSRETGGAIGVERYRSVVDGFFYSLGDWIFSSALHRDDEPPEKSTYFEGAGQAGVDLADAIELRGIAPGFIDSLARDIAASGFDVVGMTSTFDQTVASLALAAELKRLAPDTIIVMGGANCDDVQGAALHRNYPAVDFVVRGEGERSFPSLLGLIHSNRGTADAGDATAAAATDVANPAGIPGLCWRDGNGMSVANPEAEGSVAMDTVPEADFAAYFTQLHAAEALGGVAPQVLLEGGRGCWWGEKHHCTFCGLRSLKNFRSKPADRLIEEIERVAREHNVLDLLFADNIMDMGYLGTVLPELAKRDWDLRIFFEVKSNLTRAQLEVLAAAGVSNIQPGIESLSARVLRLMRKGVTGWQNVRLLRDCASLSIRPNWNLLYGFPGETEADYDPVIAQMPNLRHLPPPGGSDRIVLCRFSPYFDDPSLGLVNRGPSKLFAAVHRLPVDEVADLGYIFDSEPAGLVAAPAERLQAATQEWRRSHPGSRLVALREGDRIRIVDHRGSHRSESTLTGPAATTTFLATLRGRTPDAVVRKVRQSHPDVSEEQVRELLLDWRQRGWLFEDEGHLVALTTGVRDE